MSSKNKLEWVDFYSELADKLLSYKNKRDELIVKVFQIFEIAKINMPKLEKNNSLQDIDPFTVFGLFNKTSMTGDNRYKIMSAIASLFGIKASVPRSFYGVPLVLNKNATFYYFNGDRGDYDIDNIWNLFESALRFSELPNQNNRANFIKDFNSVINIRGIGNAKISMGLFWIRPYAFVSLDGPSTDYMKNPNNISANVVVTITSLDSAISAENYLYICDECRIAFKSGKYECSSFPELAEKAWVEGNSDKSDINNSKISKAAFLRWFGPLIQALRDLGGSATPDEVIKKIVENENLTKKEISIIRGKNKVNKFENEIRFSRAYLVKAGYIDNKIRGVWTLTENGKSVEMTVELASEIFKRVVLYNIAKRKEKNSLGDADVITTHYWIYAPGKEANMWDEFYSMGIMALGWDELGDLNTYASKDEIADKLREIHGQGSSYKNSANALWQFFDEVNPGDVIFVKSGRSEIVGRGIVDSDYKFDDNQENGYPNIRKVKWTHAGNWKVNEMFDMKTLTDITSNRDLVEKISRFFDGDTEEDYDDTKNVKYPKYSKDDFLSEVYMDEDSYCKLVSALNNKLNIILQGAPGVGKTFIAKRLAYSIMGVKDANRVKMVQFHQSYSYEDFVMGYRPSADGFEIKTGAFYDFCKRAKDDEENKYFFIIDEINRGNLSKIFGELLMLIENDKRGERNEIELLYRNESFYVPENIYIIAMMNTADRSLAMLDYALRRRFAFFDLKPGFDNEGFRSYLEEFDSDEFAGLIRCVQNLNKAITTDESLGEGFCIGHSYFCGMNPDEVSKQELKNKLEAIIEYEIIPMLKEYWFDEQMKIKEWTSNLRGSIK